MVLVKDANPRTEWPVGVVRQTFESQDGIVRKVEIAVLKVGNQVLWVRTIADLVLLLEVDE